MKVYISGAMSGLEGKNYAAFNLAALYLRILGYEVVNPAETDIDDRYRTTPIREWGAYLRKDYALVSQCDAVIALRKGAFGSLGCWSHSRGAQLERYWATCLNKIWFEV